MESAVDSFLIIVKFVTPYSLVWGLGYIGYKFFISVVLGKGVNLK